MINYDLAIQLKETGFPHEDFSICGECGDEGPEGDIVGITLSQLIEACGDKFLRLERVRDGEYAATGCISLSRFSTDDALNVIFYNTPEEAVAKLWMELQNKSI